MRATTGQNRPERGEAMAEKILALDLSTRGLGMVAGRTDWALDWKRLEFHSLAIDLRGATPAQVLDLILDLAHDVKQYASHVGATQVWAESVPVFGWNTILLGKVRAAVDFELHRYLRLIVRDAEQSTIRKHLLGYLPAGQPRQKKGEPKAPRDPSKDRKLVVCNALKVCGDPFTDNDQRDAFAVFNFACYRNGGQHLHRLLGDKPVPPPKPKKPRAPKAPKQGVLL